MAEPYDVVVVGAGGSGVPLAARLSEEPGRHVLLLEAGPAPGNRDGYPAELLDAGTVQGAMPGYAHNWSYAGSLTDELPYVIARGRILGGSTALNGGYFIRATRADFGRWAAVGGPAWSYAEARRIYERMESDAQFGHLPGHGSAGPVPVDRPPQTHRITRAFQRAATELGFGTEPDKNSDGPPGVGPVPMNVQHGVRWNTALAYLDGSRNRPNLAVQGNTAVRRVLFEEARAVGVEVARNGRISTVRAREVVLCAGAIGSAHLLLLSGIGPRDQLEAHGIPVRAARPGVGRAFADHPEVSVRWRPRAGVVSLSLPRIMESCLNFGSGADGAEAADLEILPMLKPMGYLLSGSAGALSLGLREGLRHPVRTVRAVRGIPLRRLLSDWRHQDELEFLVALQQGSSRGVLRLASADPEVQPTLDYRYLSDSEDLARLRAGVRTAAAVLESPAFRPLSRGISEPGPAVLADDGLLDTWMRSNLGTALHMCGTAPMGPAADPGAVVDPAGRVHGVRGLRVADTSILPTAPSRGPAATAVLIGELIAQQMREGSGA